ncbi:replication initiator protein [Microvirus mar63]|uniref:Replication initiator protein n=1 Tax=Microvirus mar63 TaxID=2851200 RepID=A0A8F5RB37_9VIRU|nr:replication initiator protein [Microvirus mar63]
MDKEERDTVRPTYTIPHIRAYQLPQVEPIKRTSNVFRLPLMIPTTLRNKLLTFCQHPKIIVNKYTHEPVTVSCGMCPSCILKRTTINTNLLTTYAEQFRHIWFVTLTYAPEYLPTMVVRPVEYLADGKGNDFHEVIFDMDRLDPTSEETVLFNFQTVPRRTVVKLRKSTVIRKFADTRMDFNRPIPVKEYFRLHAKFNSKLEHPHRFPYINPRDLDLFLKRFRTYYPNEKVCYYAVSEYGPTTLRPHWHLLLFSNSETFSETVHENVRKAWCYGRVDASRSRGGAAQYVAGYVNSFVSLPEIYLSLPSAVKPRSYHSIGFRRNLKFPDRVRISDIQEVADYCLDGYVSDRDGYITVVRPDWSYLIRLFPRFSRDYAQYDTCTYQLLHAAFTAPARVIRSGFSLLSTDPFSRSSRDSVLDFCREYLRYSDSFSDRKDVPFPDMLILDECRLYVGSELDDKLRLSRLYRFFLRCSKTFRTYDVLNAPEPTYALRKIAEGIRYFWQRYDYERIKDFYATLEQCQEKKLLGFYMRYYSKDVLHIDDPDIENVDSFVSDLSASALRKCRDKVKHKELNDINGIFN